MSEYVIVKNLVKNYNDFCAVDHLNFSVEEGEIFGLLGPNGAGKSTTMNIITTLDDFQKGEVFIAGMDITKQRAKVKQLVGMVPQEIAEYPYLSALENVKFFASLYGLKGKELTDAAMEALEFVGLKEKASMKPKKMSGGMKRRLNIACGIAHRPKLIIMDEPTVGVDAQSREHILKSIKRLKEKGATVIYTSHYMNEVEEICDRIAIIDHGQLVACGTEKELVALVTDYKVLSVKTRISAEFDIQAFRKETVTLPGIHQVTVKEDTVRIETTLECRNFDFVFEVLKRYGLPIISVESKVPDLDSIFLTLTGHDIH